MLQLFGEIWKKIYNQKYLCKSIVLNLVYKVAKGGLLFLFRIINFEQSVSTLLSFSLTY